MTSYWQRVFERRTSRRRALALTAGTAAGAVIVAACGGDDDGGGSGSLVTDVTDTSKEAKRGGTVKWFNGSTDPTSFDPHIQGGIPYNGIYQLTHGTFVIDKAGYLGPQQFTEITPDIAESWEWSPDNLQLTLRLRAGAKWHNRPPVNGRLIDIEDIQASWERFLRLGQTRNTLANSLNPSAPILSISTPSANTVVIKLSEPTNYVLSLLSPLGAGGFMPVPKEIDRTYNPKVDIISCGPFMLESFTPGVSFVLKRNPDYWDGDRRPYVDRLEMPTLIEYAQQVAQLRAGAIYTSAYGTTQPPRWNVTVDDAFALKQEVPQLQLYGLPPQIGFLIGGGGTCHFGWLGDSPFKDQRVRQALSLAYDRDAYIDTFFNLSKVEAQGIPAQSKYNTTMGPVEPWQLDPRSAEFGPNAQYYKHDVAEAKKLLAAAGYANGLDVVSKRVSGALGSEFELQCQVRDQMANEAGFRTRVELLDAPTVPPAFVRGQFEGGWYYAFARAPAEDAVAHLEYRYRSGTSVGFIGFEPNPQVDSMIAAARKELDTQKRIALVHDLERLLAKEQYAVHHPGYGGTFQLAWPVLRNFLVYYDRRNTAFSWWLDPTKAPLATS